VSAAAAPSGTAARPAALFVLGSGRSGTSALTRVLSLCGGTLPAGMIGAGADNPRGFWEPRKVASLNEAILRRHGRGFDPSLHLLEEDAFDAEEKAACIGEIRAYLTTLPAAPFVVIKAPKITLLSGLWFEAARLAGFESAAVITMRHPQEAIASLATTLRVSPELASVWWLKRNLLAERRTRGVPRVFVDYANLLEDWRREVKRISAALVIDLDTRDAGTIEEFLTSDLRRQRHCGPVMELFGANWFSLVYEALRAATRDEPWDQSALDRVFEAYRVSEHDFRTVFEDFHQLSNSVLHRLSRPSFGRTILEVVAMAHRRRGTWA
jgi:hypothetical protein